MVVIFFRSTLCLRFLKAEISSEGCLYLRITPACFPRIHDSTLFEGIWQKNGDHKDYWLKRMREHPWPGKTASPHAVEVLSNTVCRRAVRLISLITVCRLEHRQIFSSRTLATLLSPGGLFHCGAFAVSRQLRVLSFCCGIAASGFSYNWLGKGRKALGEKNHHYRRPLWLWLRLRCKGSSFA